MIKENINIAKNHLRRLESAIKQIYEFELFENFSEDDFEAVKILDTFVLRFIKLQDYLGQKLFRRFLEQIGEYTENMSFIDILDKLEKLGIISSTYTWMEIRKLRNKMTHEYPDEIEHIIQELKLAINYIPEIKNTVENIQQYLEKRNINMVDP